MVQLRLTNFKTGSRPNPRLAFNMENLTPFQKMQLTYCRIWGTSIGDNIKSGIINIINLGFKYLKKKHSSVQSNLNWGAIPRDHMPWVDDYSVQNMKKLSYIERRERILMRGVKIGQRKGIDGAGKFSMFNTKKSTTV